MDTLLHDFRYALRTLRASPGFTLAAVLTLALGIGANTAIFSVVDGVLLRPAPFERMDRLAMVWETDRASGTTREPASIPDYFDFRQRSAQLGSLAAFAPVEINLTRDGADPLRLPALGVSHEFLPTLGIAPLVGRGFTAEEDVPGGPRAVLISEDLWEQLFAGDEGVLGRPLRLNDNPWTIVGVLPRGADFGMLQVLGAAVYGRGFADRGERTRVDVWLPLRPNPAASRDNHPIFVLGRLADGATFAGAHREMTDVAAELERAYPSNDQRGAFVEPLADVVFAPARPALLVLLGAVALVLLVACANVANLLLARGTARARDVMVRTALGAGTARLARQFLVESAVLTAAGVLVGVVLANWGLDLMLGLAPAAIPRVGVVGVDLRVLGATLAVAAVVALAFGLLPTLQARRLDLHGALQIHAARGTSAGQGQGRFRAALVTSELALAAMLMIGAGLLIKSLWRLQQVDPGFQAAGVVKAEYQLPATRYPQSSDDWPRWQEIHRFNATLRERVAALAGVTSVTVAGAHPLEAGFTSSINVVGRETEAGDWPEPTVRQIDEGYSATLGLRIVAGRSVTASDDADAPPVIVINEAARRRFFAGHEPLGQRIRLWGSERLVIGVVADERFRGPAEPAVPAVYMPRAQAATTGYSVLVRVSGAPATLAPALRRIVRELDPSLPLFGVEPLARTLAHSMAQRRFTMIVLGAFAAVALLLAAVGVHGVLAYSLAQRTREIGVRIALGATPGGVRALVVGQGARLAVRGLAIGLLGALAVTRVLRTLLFGVGSADPLTYAGVALTLGGVALLASWLPAWRATRVDPMSALRAE